jgi:hypothetical protein
MKTVLTKFLAISSVALLMLASCKKEGAIVKATSGTPGTLTANTTTLALDKTKLNDTTTVVSFNVSKASYGYNAAVTNILQIDAPGDNWKNPTTFTLGTGTLSQGFSTAVFNSLLLKLNIPGGTTATVSVRVEHMLATNVPPIYSNVVALSVTPFNLASFVYVPGNYEGWSFPGKSADSLLSATDNGIYTGVINFKLVSDGFLIVPVQSWANKYATTANAGAAGGPITYPVEYVASGGNNFSSASKGTVDPAVNITSDLVVLNTVANTLTLTPTLWSVVGDASPGGWPASSGPQSDTDMSFNNATQTWSVVANLTAGGAIKFRLNHDWGTNLGGTGGTLSLNGANISIATSGKYLITLDPVGLTYTVTTAN